MQKNISVLIFSDFFLPGYKGGGPIKTLVNLIEATSSNDLSFRVISRDRDLGDETAYPRINCNQWNDTDIAPVFYSSLGLSGIVSIISELVKSKDNVVYLNSFFSPIFTIIPLFLLLFSSKTVILAPKGELSTGALALKAFQKRVYIRATKLLGLTKRVVFHASTVNEKSDIETVLGKNVDVFVAEDLSVFRPLVNTEQTKVGSTLKIIFISRIVPIKNLGFALSVLKRQKGNIVFDIFGPIEDQKYWEECNDIIRDMPDNVRATYRGEVNPNDVINLIAKYNLFFLPTKGENFGHVIAEALCAGTPLLISDQTPWKNLSDLGVGWDIPLTSLVEFERRIQEFAELSHNEYIEMRHRVQHWGKKKLLDDETVDKNIALFKYAYSKG